jgi:hypothetical protein
MSSGPYNVATARKILEAMNLSNCNVGREEK